MSWQFWKNRSSSVRKTQSFQFPSLVLEDNNNSFSFLKRELSHSDNKYRLVELNTFSEPSSSYEMLFKIDSEEKQIKALLKNKILNNLHETLDNLHRECEEEGFEFFTETARKNARQIVNTIYEKFPEHEYYIYPTEDREIAIDCNPYKGKGILILCDSDDGIACFVTLEGRNHRFRYDSICDFSYDLLWKTFEEFNEERKYFSHDSITTVISSIFPSSIGSFSGRQRLKIFRSK